MGLKGLTDVLGILAFGAHGRLILPNLSAVRVSALLTPEVLECLDLYRLEMIAHWFTITQLAWTSKVQEALTPSEVYSPGGKSASKPPLAL